ncbi:MAG: methionine--tRNA ligase [Moorellales bacterium]
MAEPFYVTTPIYYPSDRLHIGHALTTTMADTLARYKRLRGYDVWFLTGSDEHGQKIQRKAQEAGVSPQEYVDRIVATFQDLWQRLGISYDDFLRTTEPRHQRAVQALFRKLQQRGDIYKSTYEGWYCTPCETFWTESRLVDGCCPDCGRPVERVAEEGYFFRLSKYQDALLRYLEENPDFIQPPSRYNEMVNFVRSGLEDLCISRTTFDWGVPVPGDPKHVVYVWFDALINYISALGWGGPEPEKFERYWPAAVHLVGKDIVRFHTVIWPIMLMAAGITPPRKVFGHGWLLVGGGKMSKSKGNVVDPVVLIEKYGADAIRYFLLRELPYGADGYYSEEALRERYNRDLANDLGNLFSRTLAMIERYTQGVVPVPGPATRMENELAEVAARAVERVEQELERFDFAGALAAVWELVARANKYVDEAAPWALAREGQAERLHTVLYHLAEALRVLTVLLTPFLPGLPERVWLQMGIEEAEQLHTWESARRWGVFPPGAKVRRGPALFPRKEEQEEAPTASVPPPPARPEETKKEAASVSISIEEFARLDLRVAKVLQAEKVPGADRLLKLTVDLGQEQRTVVAGIAQSYPPEELVGRQVILVANLAPAKVRGILSQGMILAAVEGEQLSLLTVDRPIASGAKVR